MNDLPDIILEIVSEIRSLSDTRMMNHVTLGT